MIVYAGWRLSIALGPGRSRQIRLNQGSSWFNSWVPLGRRTPTHACKVQISSKRQIQANPTKLRLLPLCGDRSAFGGVRLRAVRLGSLRHPSWIFALGCDTSLFPGATAKGDQWAASGLRRLIGGWDGCSSAPGVLAANWSGRGRCSRRTG